MDFLKPIRQLFASPDEDVAQLDQQTAVAVLLLEAALYDESFVAEERHEIHRILQQRFHLNESEQTQLLDEARAHRREHPDFFHYTRLLAEQFSPEERYRFLVEVWHVVLADEQITHAEDTFTRKLVTLLRLDRNTWIRAREQAKSETERHR